MEKVITKVAKNVTIIPQDEIPKIKLINNVIKKKRVCGYARVSTNQEEQESSYEAQVDYYTNYIKGRPEWEFVNLYCDEGLSGTSIKKRDGFNRMISDALSGKIDLIITKSVSRFARNTVDSLTTIRKLKEKGVEVYFEKENIYTLDSKGELLITLMSSISQEESRSISLNTAIGKRWSFANGKVSVGYKTFLGYEKGADGKMVVNKEQAKTIKLIFKLFLKGYSLYQIKKELEKNHLKTPFGKDVWHVSTLLSIIKNEKYKGDAILQKNYTVDFLTKKYKKNEGELPKYYVTDDHEAIIDKETFDYVQVELKRRQDINKKGIYNRAASRYSGINIFSGKIVCGECGSYFGRKVWHSNDKYKKIIYRCNHKYSEDSHICNTGIITEPEIKSLFVEEYNKLNKTKVIKRVKSMIKTLTNTDSLESELRIESENLKSIITKINALDYKNSIEILDQKTYKLTRDNLLEKHAKLKEKVESISESINNRKNREIELTTFLNNMGNDKIKEFDEGLFTALVEKVVVYKNRAEIRWKGIE